MTNIKTAISIDKPLFEQVDELAQELKTSRSRIFTLAAREFIEHHKNLKLLEALNAAYDDFPDVKESPLGSAMRSRHRQMIKDQW